MGRAAVMAAIGSGLLEILKRQSDESDDDEDAPATSELEKLASRALFIMLMLIIFALFTSYLLQRNRIEAVHETVVSIFAGMSVGLIVRLTAGPTVKQYIQFDYQVFFNLLLPPIILASGYELHQANFFRNIGTILTFAFAGTFISAVVLGVILWLYTRIPLEGIKMTWLDAISIGATLSATDPVTILAIFQTYKVDPKLYTIIFGESILNDAIAIVLFETAQKYKREADAALEAGTAAKTLGPLSLFEGIGIFLAVFFASLVIGVIIGIATALFLKHTYLRRYPKIESCIIVCIAYASYFLSNGLSLSGIVTLLFCGITLKHYAYYNMSRRTQLTTKYLFQVLAQIMENFIFIYLGLSLFTDSNLMFKPLFIIVTVFGICVARWAAVFPLSKLINWFIRYKSKKKGGEVADELPYNYQAMLFWAGLRGAVGVALAAGLVDKTANAHKATVLVVVVLTVIIFGGTTARMLEILGIRTGVVEEIDSDDEFDIEPVNGASYYKRSETGIGIGNIPRRNRSAVPLENVAIDSSHRIYASGNSSPDDRASSLNRKGSPTSANAVAKDAEQDLLGKISILSDDEDGSDSSDLPPAAKRPLRGKKNPRSEGNLGEPSSYPTSGTTRQHEVPQLTASGAINSLLHGTAEDQAAWFRQLDKGFIKPKLLLDGGRGPPSGQDNA